MSTVPTACFIKFSSSHQILAVPDHCVKLSAADMTKCGDSHRYK